MSIYAIQQYHQALEKIIHYGGKKKETAISNSFYNLLNEYAHSKDLVLIHGISTEKKDEKIITPGGDITDWALEQFQNHYQQAEPSSPVCYANSSEVRDEFKIEVSDNIITKESIFHYVYAVLHNTAYRKKYELNLKREFPRIPFYKNFWQWAAWGKSLMNLHINYETATPYPLERNEMANREAPKAKLKAVKESGIIILDDNTELHGIPKQAWDYTLGNRSALEWILDQFKEKKPSDPTIAEKFNTYRFADYKEQVIDLLERVCTVSVETMKIVEQMPVE